MLRVWTVNTNALVLCSKTINIRNLCMSDVLLSHHNTKYIIGQNWKDVKLLNKHG